MVAGWRMLALLLLAAFWIQPPTNTSRTATANGQNSAPASNAAPAPNSASPPSPPNASNSASTAGGGTAPNAVPAILRGPLQPIPFSHKQHAGVMKLPCEFCHSPSRSGETLKIPQATFCMQCHQTMGTSDPGVQRIAQYAKSGGSIPWVRVYQLPSFVTFSHKIHLVHGITCQQCHGPVAERVRLFKETDISMAACVNCHREKKASVECDTCHLLESE